MRVLRSGGRSSERPDWSGTSIGNRGIMPDGRARLGLCRGRFGLCGGRRARPGQRPGAEQGAADDRAAGEDAGGPPERGGRAPAPARSGPGGRSAGPRAGWRTFTGPFNWPGGVIHPTGAKLDVPCADFWYIENGKIKEFNCHVSMDVMFRQMGGKLVFASDGAESSAAAS